MLKPVDFYIDLGTANTLIYGKGRGFLLNEPSVLALKNRSHGQDLFGLGRPAKAMLGRNPEKVTVLRPLREGVIADFDHTTQMLQAFIRRVKENVFWLRPRLLISLPCEVSAFERQAVKEAGYQLGARRVDLLDEPMAAAIGADLPVLGRRAQMVVDIGGGTTEIAVVSMGGIVVSSAVRVGGDDIDQAIVGVMRNQFNFVVGEPTAEKLKIGVATALPEGEERRMQAGGFDLVRGLPGKVEVRSGMLASAVEGVLKEVILAVKKALEATPPEVSGDIAENGIVLAGGGALLHGLSGRFSRELGLPVRLAKDPLFSVAQGGAKALEENRLFDVIERPA